MRSYYHKQTRTESALISGLDHKANRPSGYVPLSGHKPRPRPQPRPVQTPPAHNPPPHIPPPPPPQHKKQFHIVDGKIKEVFVKIERPPFWERPKNKSFLNLIMGGHKKQAFYKKILVRKLEVYNKENPHRIEPIPEWLMTPEQSYKIVEIEKDKAYKIVNRKDGTLVMDGLKSHKQATWTLHNKLLKKDKKSTIPL